MTMRAALALIAAAASIFSCHLRHQGEPLATPGAKPRTFGSSVDLSAEMLSWYSTVSAVAVTGGGKRLFSWSAINGDASPRYFQVFDSTTAPTSGAVPAGQWMLPPVSGSTPGEVMAGTDVLTGSGWAVTNGIAWGISTTRGSYTAATASEHDVTVTVTR